MKLGRFLGNENRFCLSSLLLFGVMVFAAAEHSAAEGKTGTNSAPASSASTQQLQNAVHRLNAWLHGSGQGPRWRRELMLNVLEAQSAKGAQADIGTLYQIYSRFCGSAPELKLAPFMDVRNALQREMQNLSGSKVGDLPAAVALARTQFRQVTVADLANQRDLAKQSLQALKGYWRETIPSRERAELFEKLELDEAIAFLDQLKFELAPEVSTGKMSSLIRDVQSELNDVVREIDALPFESALQDDGEQKPKESVDPGNNSQDPAKNAQEPGPETDKPSRDELEKKRLQLQTRIDELKKKRLEIDRADKPRQNERRDAFNRLRKFEDNLVKLSEVRGDPYFVSALMTYQRFVRGYFYGTSDNLQEEFLRRIEALESDLANIDGPESRAYAGKVGDHLSWLENANQVSHVVTAIRARHSLPNIYVSVASRLLNQVASKAANEMQCVNETIDGRLVKGKLYTNVNVAIDLQNDPNQVHASIHLTGNLCSNTYIDQGKIRAFASTTGQLEGRRSIYANVGGFYAGAPRVAANIKAFFNGTDSSFRLVDRIATRKFDEVKQRTEGITARKAEDELSKRFAQQTDDALTEGNAKLAEAQVKIIEKTIFLPEAYVRSFPSEIMLIGKKANDSSLGAQTAPAIYALPADVMVRIHDSTPSNYLDKIFSGKTFSNEDLAQELGSIVGEAPDTLIDKPGQDKDESFSITFANIRPIQVEFADQLLRVVVSGRAFSQGDKKINEGLKIILQFKIARIDGKLKFVRAGDAEIDYLEPDKKRPATVAFRSFLIGKLNPQDGGEELSADLPDNLMPVDEVEQLQNSEIARGLQLIQCRSENGWLYLGWKYQDPSSFMSLVLDTPAIWPGEDLGPTEPLDNSAPAIESDPVVPTPVEQSN